MDNYDDIPQHYCFVAMPFRGKFKNVWELCIAPAVGASGLIARRGDNANLGTNIVINDITTLIYNSTLVIADLTNCTPNVMYELGLAHAAKKNVVMVTQSDDDIPFNLGHIRYLTYRMKDLKQFERDLRQRISDTLEMPLHVRPDYFPDLTVLNEEQRRDFHYQRQRNRMVTIDVTPPSADVFFNDVQLEREQRTISYNKDADRSTISATAIGHYEHHEEIDRKEAETGLIRINLLKHKKGKAHKAYQETQIAKWLVYRRRDPQSPVLMRAVAMYLDDDGQLEESKQELQELLRVAPNWWMAQNLAGRYARKFDMEKALAHYRYIVAAEPNIFVGYYNQACVYALRDDFKTCMYLLERILKKPAVLKSFSGSGFDVLNDSDFEGLRKEKKWKGKFVELATQLNQASGASTALESSA